MAIINKHLSFDNSDDFVKLDRMGWNGNFTITPTIINRLQMEMYPHVLTKIEVKELYDKDKDYFNGNNKSQKST